MVTFAYTSYSLLKKQPNRIVLFCPNLIGRPCPAALGLTRLESTYDVVSRIRANAVFLCPNLRHGRWHLDFTVTLLRERWNDLRSGHTTYRESGHLMIT